nr:Zinc knuckle family protein [Ipomoea batatas]
MTSRRISGFDTTPTYVGEEPSVFTIKLHIGGDLVWHPTTGYKDGGVEYFDHFNCHEGSLLDLRIMVKQLRFCDKKVQFWVLVKGKGRKNSRKPELKPIINDADIVNLVGDVPPNKELDIFVEHLFDDQWDYDVEISRELGDDCLLYDESSENEVEVEQESGNEVEEDNLIDSGTSSKQVNPNVGLDCDEVQEVDCELSEEVLRSLENSDDSDGELNVLENVFQESDLKKEGFKFVIGMIFKSADEFKWAVKYHEATRRKDIHFIKNEGRRVRVICRHSSICKWTIFASRSNPRSPFAVKTYCPEHTCGDQDENKTVNSGFLAKMYKDDIKLNTEWGRTQFQEHAEYKKQLDELKELNAKAADWLAARDAKHYCRAFFSTFPKTDMLLNNLCESWNSSILNFRDKPILTLCERLRIYLMTRMQKNRERLKSHSMKICPKICKLIEQEKERASRFITYKSHENIYQVDDENFKAYSYKKTKRKSEDYVHNCYTVEAYLRAYEPAIQPILSSVLWPKSNLPDPLPPKYKAQPGRPKKKRKINPIEESKKGTTEMKTRKVGEVKRCTVCGVQGHNKKTCKGLNPQGTDMDEVIAGESDVGIEGQFEDIAVETQVSSFVLEEMEVMNSQPSQVVLNQGPPMSSFISSQMATGSSNPSVITRSGRNYVTVATLQQSKAVQRETRKKKAIEKKKQN